MFQLGPCMPPMNTAHFVWNCIGNRETQRIVFDICKSFKEIEEPVFASAPGILPCILGHDIYILLRPCLQLQGPSPRQHGEIDNVSLKLLLPSHFLPSQRPSTLPPTSTILLLLLPPPEAKAARPVCKLGGIRAELNPSLVINLSLWQLPAWERGEAEPAGTELVACFLPGRSRTKAAPSFLPSDLTAPGPGVQLLTSRRFLFGGSVEV
ncbi:hypothetical protein BHE74_00043436 [Ensete ventricosum]|nr:hypothetical protein BHE74_00043436 [Ensete ventricosum]